MRKYMDHLPGYLDGPNIRAHAGIIDAANLDVNTQLQVLALWSKLSRPVMIQRRALSLEQILMTVYIDVPQLIKKITISGDYNEEYTYTEDEMTSKVQVSFYLQGDASTLTNPDLTVTVETFDEIVYTKSYPENDTQQGTYYDHDEFLDRIGALLGVPRRIYKEYSFVDAAKSTPKYFGKVIEDSTVLSCTEDDYYYYERIQYYLENFNKMALPILLLRTIYGYEHVTELNTSTIENDSTWTFIRNQIHEDIPVNERPATYVFLVNRENPVNIQSLSDEEKLVFLEKYIPITRKAYLLPQILTNLELYMEDFPKRFSHDFDISLWDENDMPIKNRRIIFTLDNNRILTPNTNTDGMTAASFPNVPMGYHTIHAEHPSGGGYEGSEDTRMYKSYIDQYEVFEQGLNVPAGVDTLITEPLSNEYTGLLFGALITGLDYLVSVVGRNSASDEWHTCFTTALRTQGQYTFTVDIDTQRIFLNTTEVEVDVQDDVSEYKEIALMVRNMKSYCIVADRWVTHYDYYDNVENIVLDEFTLRYIVSIPSGDSYVAVLGEALNNVRYGFSLDLLEYTTPGRHYLEYKFLNFKCYLYIDGEYTGAYYDFSSDVLTTGDLPGGEISTEQCNVYQYTRSPRLLTGDMAAYFIPITDYPGIPVHEGEVTPRVWKVTSRNPVDSDGVEGDYTTLMFRDTLIYLEIGAKDQNNRPLNGRAHIVISGYPDGATLDGNTDTTVKLVNGEWHGYLPGLEEAGEIRFEVDIPAGWRRLQSNVMRGGIRVVAAPMRFDYWSDGGYISYDESDSDDMGTLIYYTSATRSIPLGVDLRPRSHPWNNPDDPRLVPSGLTVHSSFDGVELPDTVIVDGRCTIDLPTTTKPKSGIVELGYDGDSVYAAETTVIPFEILQNRAVLVVEAPEYVLVDTEFNIEYHVFDLYGDPIYSTVLASAWAKGVKTSGHTDAEGNTTLPVTISEAGVANINCSVSATGYTSKASQVVNVQVLSEPVTPDIEILTEELYKGATNQLQCRVTYQNKPVHEGKVLAKVNAKSVKGEDGKVIYFYLNTVDDGLVTIPATIAQTSTQTSLPLQFQYVQSGVYSGTSQTVTVPVVTPEGGGELINNSILPCIEPITTTPTTGISMIQGAQKLRVFLQGLTIQPSTTGISQNDNIALPVTTLTYDEDYTTDTDILVDDILIINNTLQEYISVKNKNTHTDTTGMTQEIITNSRVNYSVKLDTNKLTCNIANINTLQAHGWTKNEDYTLIILQEDEKIEIPFTTT